MESMHMLKCNAFMWGACVRDVCDVHVMLKGTGLFGLWGELWSKFTIGIHIFISEFGVWQSMA